MKLKGRYKVKKLRVIVCGSTFGQYYIRALQTVPDEFEVVGLLANGSNRSKLCADFYHVPLYTQIEDIPEVDIACVTCVLFDCPENYFERLGSIKYAVSQTPQVFLDNQITEMGGRLHISWDVVDELFEACIIDEIFLEFV